MSHGLLTISRLLLLTVPLLLCRCSESNFKAVTQKSALQKKSAPEVDNATPSNFEPSGQGDGDGSSPCTEADVVSFEPSLGFAPVRGMAITNQFEASHGVSFSIEGASASPVLAEINVADPPAFKEDGSGRINALVDAQSKAIMQKFFLTLPIRHAVLVVTYSKPVKEASGYMFDIDNSESWTITPYDANGRELPGAWSYAARDNEMIYNGKSMLWTIKERPTADISMIKFKGVKPANSNGASLAFDRFSPGKVCP